jgi:hypothetical protein
LHAQAHAVVFLSFGPDHQLPRTIVDAAHRFEGVPEQGYDDLLELDTISCDRGDLITKFLPQNHPSPLKFTPQQRNHLVLVLSRRSP